MIKSPKDPLIRQLWVLLAAVTLVCLAARAGRVLNYLLPALTFAVAWVFARRAPTQYIRLLIVALIFAPLLRRLADYAGVFTDPSPMLLIPYLVPLASLRTLRLSTLTRRSVLPFTLALVAIAYGLLVGLVSVPEHTAPLIPALRWACPIFAAIYITQLQDRASTTQALLSTLRWATLASALYALVQIVILPPWDYLWLNTMLETGQGNSYGRPAAFAFRSFGTLNSTGVAAGIWGIGVLAWLVYQPAARRRWTRIAALATLSIAIFLTLVRTEWLCLPAATFVGLFALRPAARRSSLFALAGAAAILLATATLLAGTVPELRNSITDRITSMGDSTHDESLQARSLAIHAALDIATKIPFGTGMGFLDSPAYSRTPMGAPTDDSSADLGIVGMIFELGYLGTAIYLAAFVLLAVAVWRMPSSPVAGLVKAVLVLNLVHTWSTNPFIAPGALLLWTLGALALEGVPARSTPIQHQLQTAEVHA